MKTRLSVIALLCLIGLLILLLLQQVSTAREPVLLVQDMALPPTAAHPAAAPPVGTVPFGPPPAPREAAQLFTNHCAVCHGANGNGQSYTAAYPGMPAVGNLTTIRKSAPELKQSLREGRGAMPAFHNKLQETEIDSLIHHILTHFQQK